MLCADYSGTVVFLGLPGLRFTGTGSVCGSVAASCAGASGTTSSGFTFFGRPGLLLGVSSTFTFFGLPGLRLGFVSTGFSFFGLPGLLFGVWSKGASVELIEEAAIGVVEIKLVVELIPLSFNFLGLPGLRFVWIIGCSGVSGCDSGSDAIFRLPLFTSVKSGLTWYAFCPKATFIRANLSAISRFVYLYTASLPSACSPAT